MTCREFEKLLPAYPEDFLSREEKKGLEGHLASCPHCRQVLRDLQKTEEVLQGLEEVEAPPFFEQKIMSHIREARAREKGLIRRLFYPLHIKVPIQALATVLIAVLGFYVYQRGEPDVKQVVPLPLPVAETRKGEVAAGPPGGPAAALSARDKADFPGASGERGEKGAREDVSRPPTREELPQAAKPDGPVMEPQKKQPPEVQVEALKAEAPVAKTRQEAVKALEATPAERSKAEPVGAGAMSGETRKKDYAPSPSRMAVASSVKQSIMELTIQVGDASAALRRIEERLDQVSARVTERRLLEGSEGLKAEIPGRNLVTFLEGLAAVGRVNAEKRPAVDSDADVTVSIRIVVTP